MQRRTVLRAVGATGLAGLSAASGCLGALDSAFDRGGPGWRHGVGGWVDTVESGLVFGREVTDDRGVFDLGGGDGSVFALDAATGEREWSYGETSGHTYYTPPRVDGGVYFALNDDVRGNGFGELRALNRDGTERWVRGVESTYSPLVDGDVVYAGSTDGMVRAYDADDGAVRWETDGFGSPPRVVWAGDQVVAAANRIVGLDPDSGAVLWRYGQAPFEPSLTTAVDGVAYSALDDEEIAAVSDGEQLWRADVDGWIEAVAAGHVFIHAGELVAIEADSGDVAWRSGGTVPEFVDAAVGDGTLFVGGDRLAAVRVQDWTERWSRPLDGPVRRVVTDDSGRSVYAVTGATAVQAFEAGGDPVWEREVDGRLVNTLVDDRLYLGTSVSVCALGPSSGDGSETTTAAGATDAPGAGE